VRSAPNKFRATIVPVGIGLSILLTLLLFRLPLVGSLQELIVGSFTTPAGLSRTLVKMVPLLLTGLGMVVAWKAGVYNIGGEGQFVIGGLGAAMVAKLLVAHVPGGLLNPVLLLSAMASGAVFALLAGWLQVVRGVQAVISTILLNFIALQLMSWAIRGPLQRADKTLPQTERLPETVMLLRFDRQFDLHSGLIYALLVTVAVWVILYRTSFGFQLRLVGANPKVARANRISSDRVTLQAMALSGALCGLAGAIDYTGMTGLIGDGFAQGWGFLAIPVALLGGLHVVGSAASSVFFGALFAGSENLGRFTEGGDRLVYVIQAVAVFAYLGFKAWEERQPVAVTEDA
jgi:general nucleoside transport system permease protein